MVNLLILSKTYEAKCVLFVYIKHINSVVIIDTIVCYSGQSVHPKLIFSKEGKQAQFAETIVRK